MDVSEFMQLGSSCDFENKNMKAIYLPCCPVVVAMNHNYLSLRSIKVQKQERIYVFYKNY